MARGPLAGGESLSVVTLLTDFGGADSYVAEMKGTILARAPGAVLVDVTHEVAPGNIAGGAYLLGRSWRHFPAGTVHLAVVDPGVGTSRRPLAAEAGGHRFVAPDNGLLTQVLATQNVKLVELAVPAGAAATFHGRDVFAPAAAALAAGSALESLGRVVTDPARLPAPKLLLQSGKVLGTVVHVDRFGSLVTNIPAGGASPATKLVAGGRAIMLKRTFGDVAPGELLAYAGSGGTIEIAVRDGRADQVLQLGVGAEVTL